MTVQSIQDAVQSALRGDINQQVYYHGVHFAGDLDTKRLAREVLDAVSNHIHNTLREKAS